MKNIFFVIILLLFVNQTFAQNDTIIDSVRNCGLNPPPLEGLGEVQSSEKQEILRQVQNDEKKTNLAYYIVPSALISYGIITRFSSGLQNFDKNIDVRVKQNISRRYRFDDYIQFAPYVAIYGLDLCGVKAKHNLLDRTLVLGTSAIFAATLTQGSKYLTKIERPDGSNFHSFPSGHTSVAFLGAHILFREYKHKSVWIGVAGYGVALTTASMRVINRKHWLSDVVTGAGVGILCAELGYLMLPVWHKLFKINQKDKGLAISPIITRDNFGIGGIMVF